MNSKKSGNTKWRVVSQGEIWRPKTPGEKIEGILTSQQVGYDAKNAMEFPSVTIVGKSVWSIRTDRHQLQALNRFAKGTPVQVTYLGKKKVNNLNPMMLFEVSVPDDVKEVPDWTSGKFIRKDKNKAKRQR